MAASFRFHSHKIGIPYHNAVSTTPSDLVTELPEIYRPIFGHPEFCPTVETHSKRLTEKDRPCCDH